MLNKPDEPPIIPDSAGTDFQILIFAGKQVNTEPGNFRKEINFCKF